MKAKDKVLEYYPQSYAGGRKGAYKGNGWWVIYNTDGDCLGDGPTEELAWANALLLTEEDTSKQ